MMLTRSHARSIGWAMVLAVCFALTVALTFRVNAVRSQVRLTERRIAALQTDKAMLETEFETRANQQQLTALNEVEFGYQAPSPGQYLESERQLAVLGKPRGPDAPPMIRVAAADPRPAGNDVAGAGLLPTMVNPLTGKDSAAAATRADPATPAKPRLAERSAAGLAERLAHVEQLSHVEKSPRVIAERLARRKVAGAALEAKVVAAGKTAKAGQVPGKGEPKLAKADAKAERKVSPKVTAKPVRVVDAKAGKAAPAAATRSSTKAVRVAESHGVSRPGKNDRIARE